MNAHTKLADGTEVDVELNYPTLGLDTVRLHETTRIHAEVLRSEVVTVWEDRRTSWRSGLSEWIVLGQYTVREELASGDFLISTRSDNYSRTLVRAPSLLLAVGELLATFREDDA